MSSVVLGSRSSNYQADPVGRPNLGNMDADMVKLYNNDIALKAGLDVITRDDGTLKDYSIRGRMLHPELANLFGGDNNTINIYTGTVSGVGYDPSDEEFGAVGDGSSHPLTADEAAVFNSLFGDYGLVAVAGDEKDWAAWQAAAFKAIATGEYLRPRPGSYIFNRALVLGDYTAGYAGEHVPSIIGLGVTLTQSTAAAWTIYFDAERGAQNGVIDYGFELTGLSIIAKNGICLGSATEVGAFGGDSSGKAYLLGFKVNNCTIIGTYGSGVDGNYQTTVVPTESELSGYGVGLQVSKGFNFQFSGVYVVGCGIGYYFIGTDISTVLGGRLQSNARHIHAKAIGTFGGQSRFMGIDILGNFRQYGIYNDAVEFYQYLLNFFENSPALTFLRDVNTIGTQFSMNRINSPTSNTVPWISIASHYGFRCENNLWAPNAWTAPFEVESTYWEAGKWVLAHVINNDPRMPVPNYPSIDYGMSTDRRFAYDNTQQIGGAITTGNNFPWELSGDRWVIKKHATDTAVILWTQKTTPGPRVRVRVVGLYSGNEGGINLQYRYGSSGSYTTLFNGGLDFTNSGAFETRDYFYTLTAPVTDQQIQWQITIDNSGFYLSSIEIVTLDDDAGHHYDLTNAVARQYKTFISDTLDQSVLPWPSDTGLIACSGPIVGGKFKTLIDGSAANKLVSVQRTTTFGSAKWHGWGVGETGAGMYGISSADGRLIFATREHVEWRYIDSDPYVGTPATDTLMAKLYSTGGNGRLSVGYDSIALARAPDDAAHAVQGYGGLAAYNGPLTAGTVGHGLRVKTGSGAKAGVGAVMVGGTVTVANTSITSGSIIIPIRTAAGGTVGEITVTKIAATSFTFTSSSGTETSTFSWVIVEIF